MRPWVAMAMTYAAKTSLDPPGVARLFQNGCGFYPALEIKLCFIEMIVAAVAAC
jgi:hypothetical protein